jgi:hypothetical protein
MQLSFGTQDKLDNSLFLAAVAMNGFNHEKFSFDPRDFEETRDLNLKNFFFKLGQQSLNAYNLHVI